MNEGVAVEGMAVGIVVGILVGVAVGVKLRNNKQGLVFINNE